MESNQSHEESTISSEQPDHSSGIGRSYECVFCKRGFNTAQALGGHMNIHRKDRARNKPSSSSSNINSTNWSMHPQENAYSVPGRFYQQCSPHYVALAPHEAVAAHFDYRTYFPAPTSNVRPIFANHRGLNIDRMSQQRSNPFGDDNWRMGLSLPCGPALNVDDIGKSRRGGTQEEELDLELRLGS